MADAANTTARPGILGRATIMLAWVGGVCLLAVVAIVALGVFMRYVMGSPILGINEFVQLAALALVMASMPYCTWRNDHVNVDVFDKALRRWGRMIGDLLSRALAIFVLSILAHRATLKALDALEWGDATNMLGLPIWPFYGILAFGTALCVAVYLGQVLSILKEGPK